MAVVYGMIISMDTLELQKQNASFIEFIAKCVLDV